MTGTNGRSRGPFGPLEHLDEVQREIVDAALRVTSELTALAGDVAGEVPAKPRAHATPADIGAIRATVSKSMDLVVDVLHGLLDSGLDAIEQYQSGQRIHLEVVPGASLSLQGIADLARVDDVLVTPLTSRDRRVLSGPGAGEDEIAVPLDTEPGEFHGVVLSIGDDSVTLLVTVVVTRGQ